MLPVVVLLLASSLAIAAQGPLLPTLARLDALKLASIEGDVPARYSNSVSRDVASALARRIADCRGLLVAAAGRPSIVLALLDRADWERVSDRPYGMPHHGTADSPYVIVIPQSWRDAAPMFTGVRTHLAGALGAHEVDRYVHLTALHEVGHLLTNAALGTTTEATRTRFPFWYGEFLANYLADGCFAPQAEEGAFRRRGAAALAAIPRQRFTTLDDADRLLTERDPSGPPYVTTEAGGLDFARYQGFTGQMASRLRDAGLNTTRLLEILRQQWARPGRQGTAVLLKDLAGIAPGWDEWLVDQGAISIPTAAQSTLSYPQWRGQQRDGAASGFIEPKSWPKALTRRWKVDVGAGYATPLVIGDTLYVFTRRGENEVMMALNSKTGAELWRSSYPAPYSPTQPAAPHGAGPKATPLYYEGKLFTLGISGIVSAFDAAAGKLLWQTPPPAEHPLFSAASSPLGENGLVIAHPGNYGPLTAFDSNTGEIKWTAGSAGFFASPIIVNLAGTRQVVSATQDSIIGVSLDGRVLWRYPWEGGGGSTTPVLNGETIILSALGKGVTAIRPTVRDGKWVVEPVWKATDVAMYVSNPVVVAETLFGLSHRARGQFFALDAKSGEVLWLGQPREADNTALVTSGDLLFLLNDDAELIVARASRSGFDPIVRYTVADSATWAQPTISGNRIFVKDVTSLSLWTFD